MHEEKNELTVVNNLAQGLNNYGKVSIGYVTAELKPFSKQQKPDLEFKGKNSNTVLFVTFEIFNKEYDNYKNLLMTVIEYQKFAIDKENMKFVYATNISIPNDWKEDFRKNNIILIASVKDSKDISKELLSISGISEN